MVRHIVIDVGVHLRSGVKCKNGIFVKLQQRQRELEEEWRTSPVVLSAVVVDVRHERCNRCWWLAQAKVRHVDCQISWVVECMWDGVGTVQA